MRGEGEGGLYTALSIEESGLYIAVTLLTIRSSADNSLNSVVSLERERLPSIKPHLRKVSCIATILL
jgi:hypothetical protein